MKCPDEAIEYATFQVLLRNSQKSDEFLFGRLFSIHEKIKAKRLKYLSHTWSRKVRVFYSFRLLFPYSFTCFGVFEF